jgi:hypothetical protein
VRLLKGLRIGTRLPAALLLSPCSQTTTIMHQLKASTKKYNLVDSFNKTINQDHPKQLSASGSTSETRQRQLLTAQEVCYLRA